MTRASSSLPRPSRGFTLLEIIIATAVGAIVLLVINSTFFGALRLGNTTQERTAADLELRRALGIVRRDLAGLMLPGNTLAGPLQTTLSSALTQGSYGDQVGPDLYTNSAAIDGWSPFAEIQLVEYYLAAATDGTRRRTLFRAVTRNLLPAQTTTPDLQPLLNGVAEATIDFYDGTSWTTAWDSATSGTMPTAVRFQLTLEGTDAAQPALAPITLVVPVLVATAASTTTTGGTSP